jgi:hypothetical protein
MFEVLTDAESIRAAQDITNVLQFSGWNIIGTNRNPDLYAGFFDGATVWYKLSLPGTEGFSADQKPKLEAEERCREAAEALACTATPLRLSMRLPRTGGRQY